MSIKSTHTTTVAPAASVGSRIRATLADIHHANKRIVQIQMSTGRSRLG